MKSSLRHYFFGWKKKHLSNETKIKSRKKTKTASVREEKNCIPSLLIHFVLVLFWAGDWSCTPLPQLFDKATHKSRAVSSKDRTMIIRSKRFLSRTEGEPLEQRHQVEKVTHGARAVVVERLCGVVLWFTK